MGLKVDPGEIQKFTSDICSNAESLAESLEDSMIKIENFENEKELDGVSWNGTKEQLANHKYVIQGIIAASDMMREDAYTLASSVGNEVLDEDELKEKLCTQKTIRIEAQKSVNNYRVKNGKSLADGTVTNYSGIISIYLSTISICESLIDGYENKLDKLEAIENRTSSLFLEATDLFNAVQNVNATLGGSWNGSSFTATVPEEYISLIKGAWENTKDVRELRQLGVTIDQYRNMEKIGYTAEGIKALVASCVTEEDRQFLAELMNEDYISAFAISPASLSEGMALTMANYATYLARWLTIEDGCKKLQEFNNAIYQYEKTGISPIGYSSNAGAYLSRLYAGTQLLLEMNSNEILNLTEAGAKDKNYLLMAMSSLWGAQYQVITSADFDHDLGKVFKNVEINQLKYNESMHKFSFDMLYVADKILLGDSTNGYKPVTEEITGSWQISTECTVMPSDLDGEKMVDAMRELEEQADELREEYFLKGSIGTIITAVSAWNPLLGMGLSALCTIEGYADMELGALTDKLNEKTGGEYTSVSVESLVGILGTYQDYLNSTKAIDNMIMHVKDDYMMSMFGAGGICEVEGETYLIFDGIYNPNSLEKLGQWQKNGLTGLDSKFTSKDIESLLDYITRLKKKDSETIRSNAEVLIKGGNIVNMDPLDLYKAIKVVEEAVRETKEWDEWTIQLYFEGGEYVP